MQLDCKFKLGSSLLRLRQARAATVVQVQDFVNRYMPAYQAYLPGMYAKGPSTAESHKEDGNPGLPHNVLIFEIDESRGLSGSKTPSSAASLQS